MASTLWASQTAIERFRDLFAPGYSMARAKTELISLTEQARKTQDRGPRGEELWLTGTNEEVLLVVKRDPPPRHRVSRPNSLPTIVTVLRRRADDVVEWEPDPAA